MGKPSILITGANRGIGLELSRQFAEDGWRVFACCRNPDSASELQAMVERGLSVEPKTLDVTDYDGIRALAAELADQPIDILLSNAGIYGAKGVGFGQVDPVEWREVFEVNSIAPLMLAQAFVEQVAASAQKLVAVISSKVGSIADNSSGGSYVYRSSKTAVNQVVKCLSIDLQGRGISVISLHPGWVQTEMGGPNAQISTHESVSGLRQVLQAAGPEQSGQFIEFNGEPIAW